MTFGPEAYRTSEAVKHGLSLCTEDIVGIVDEDLMPTAHLDSIDDGLAICDGDFFERIERLLDHYRNLIVFGATYFTNPAKTSVKLWTNHPRVIWSTEDRIRHAYNLIQADCACFMRRDFLEEIGGAPGGVGYGEARRDLCIRAMKAGGVIGMFRDLPYYHVRGRYWRMSQYPAEDPEWYRLNVLRTVES